MWLPSLGSAFPPHLCLLGVSSPSLLWESWSGKFWREKGETLGWKKQYTESETRKAPEIQRGRGGKGSNKWQESGEVNVSGFLPSGHSDRRLGGNCVLPRLAVSAGGLSVTGRVPVGRLLPGPQVSTMRTDYRENWKDLCKKLKWLRRCFSAAMETDVLKTEEKLYESWRPNSQVMSKEQLREQFWEDSHPHCL